MNFLGLHSPFFKPLWRRIATVAVCVGWAGIEFSNGAALWGMLFLAAGLYAGLQFFVFWKPPED